MLQCLHILIEVVCSPLKVFELLFQRTHHHQQYQIAGAADNYIDYRQVILFS